MKKVCLFLSLIALAGTACNKDKEVTTKTPDTPIITKTYADQTIMPGTADSIGQYLLKVGNMDNFYFGPDFTFTTTTLTNFKNFHFTVKRKSDLSVVLTSKTVPTVTKVYKYPEYNTLPKNGEYIVTLYADVLAGTTGEITTAMDIEYYWAGSKALPNSTNPETVTLPYVTGQKVTVSPYAVTPIYTWVQLTGVITDSVNMNVYKHSIQSPVSGATAHKQFAYGIVFADNGANDTLSLLDLMFFENSIDVTNKVTFSNAAGVPITKMSESDTKLFVTYTAGIGEFIVPAGETADFMLSAKPAGFHHSNDGDGFNLVLLGDDAAVAVSNKYLNRGTSGSHAKLSSTAAANSSAIVVNRPWSDMSAGPAHSAIFGLSSPDWYGNKSSNLTVQIWHQ